MKVYTRFIKNTDRTLSEWLTIECSNEEYDFIKSQFYVFLWALSKGLGKQAEYGGSITEDQMVDYFKRNKP